MPDGYRLCRRLRKSASLTQADAASTMASPVNSATPGTTGNPADTSMPRAANSARAEGNLRRQLPMIHDSRRKHFSLPNRHGLYTYAL